MLREWRRAEEIGGEKGLEVSRLQTQEKMTKEK